MVGLVAARFGRPMAPGDPDLDPRLALLLDGLDLQREVAVRVHRDLVVAERDGQRPCADAIGEAAQQVRHLPGRRRALELELLPLHHCRPPSSMATRTRGRRGQRTVISTRLSRLRCTTLMSRSRNSEVARTNCSCPDTTPTSPDRSPLASSER